MHLLAERFDFVVDDRDFLNEEIKNYILVPAMLLLTRQLFSVFTSVVYACVQ